MFPLDTFAFMPEWVLKLIFDALVALVALANFLFWRDIGRERKAIDEKFSQISVTLGRLEADIKERFARAGANTSDLATEVQGLPDRLRKEWREDFEIMHGRHR